MSSEDQQIEALAAESIDSELKPKAPTRSHLDGAGETATTSTSSGIEAHPSILCNIFQHLSHELENEDLREVKIARRALLRAACARKSFTAPALSALWRVLDSLFPLLRLFSSFFQVNLSLRYILGKIHPGDWLKFDEKAKHVRVLVLRQEMRHVSLFALDRLRQQHQGPILPALRRICIMNDFDTSTSLAPFISLSVSVRSIELLDICTTNRESLMTFVESALDQAPNLAHLTLQSRHSEFDTSNLLGFSSLRSLELEAPKGHLSQPFLPLVGLGQLPCLKTLALKTGSYIPPISGPDAAGTKPLDSLFEEFCPTIPKRLFTRLEQLKLVGHPDATLIFLAYIYPSSLQVLHIDETRDLSGAHDIAAIKRKSISLNRLAIATTRLKACTIRQSDRGIVVRLSSFLQFSQLETLEITDGSANVSNEDMAVIAIRLPYLKTLILPARCYNEAHNLNFLWLPQLLPPRLERLKISVSVTNDRDPKPPPPPLPGSDIKFDKANAHYALRHLAISSALSIQSDAMISRLSKLAYYAFPNLDVLEGFGPDAGQECWDRVNIFRTMLKEVQEESGK